jgi:hypothetical protein
VTYRVTRKKTPRRAAMTTEKEQKKSGIKGLFLNWNWKKVLLFLIIAAILKFIVNFIFFCIEGG